MKLSLFVQAVVEPKLIETVRTGFITYCACLSTYIIHLMCSVRETKVGEFHN